MILPRRLIDNLYIIKDSWMLNMLQHTESFERKIYDVLATTEWWPKVSKTDKQTFDVFCDAYYIVTLCLMRNGQRPENWCDDFFDIMGQERNEKGEYTFIEERQWAVMSIVLCVFKHMNEDGLHNLMFRIENRLKKGKGYEVLERILGSTKDAKYRQNKKKYAPQDLRNGLRFDRINWYDYIDVFDNITGEYKSDDLLSLLATLGSGRAEEDVEYPIHKDDYDKARGKLERLCIADALEDFFQRDESQQKKGNNLEGPAKDFESLWKDFEWHRGELLDWLTGSGLEYDDDAYYNPEVYEDKYANKTKCRRPPWIDDADNWPALTVESFVYFLDDDRKNKQDKDGSNLTVTNYPDVFVSHRPTFTANASPKKNRKLRHYFCEYIKDSERTDEIIAKIHRHIGNKKDADAIQIIVEAMWIELIDKPSAPSVKEEFRDNITCSDSYVSRKLKDGEVKPKKKDRKVDEERLDKIREEFE